MGLSSLGASLGSSGVGWSLLIVVCCFGGLVWFMISVYCLRFRLDGG